MPDEKSTDASSTVSQRLMSLDALRGFDMFWIIGAEDLFHALNKISDTGITRVMAEQLDHEDWEGFHFYDLIFPLFVFIVGASLVFSLSKTIETVSRAAAVRRVLRRGVVLFLIGIFYYGGFSHEWPNIRLMGVLNRIALCYLFAGLFFCFFRPATKPAPSSCACATTRLKKSGPPPTCFPITTRRVFTETAFCTASTGARNACRS